VLPAEPLSVLVPDLGAFGVDDVSCLTPVELDLNLVVVELIKLNLHGVLQTCHIPLGVKSLPRLDARVSLA
jgi:hypothetical protein